MSLYRSTLLHLEALFGFSHRSLPERDRVPHATPVCATLIVTLSIFLLAGPAGGVNGAVAFSAGRDRDTSEVGLPGETTEERPARQFSSPFAAFAAIEQAWNMGWADSIATFFPDKNISLRLDKNVPESASFTKKQASYMLGDSFRYRVTDSFRFLEFKYGKSGKKPPLAKAQWSFRREPTGKVIAAKVQVTLRKEGEHWLISGIRIQD